MRSWRNATSSPMPASTPAPASIAFDLRDLPGAADRIDDLADPDRPRVHRPRTVQSPEGLGRRFTAERANECWPLDDTAWTLADGTEVKILNVIDDHSRLLRGIAPRCPSAPAQPPSPLSPTPPELGWPQRFWSDNAQAFTTPSPTRSPSSASTAEPLPALHPHTNGKVERFHQTLRSGSPNSLPRPPSTELQAQLDLFRHLYNHHRPHRPSAGRFPADVWTDAPKTGPADQPLGDPHHRPPQHRPRRRAPRAGRYAISVGTAHNGPTALTVITGTNAHVFINGRLVRQLTLDPTQRAQPLYTRPGRPPTITEREDPRHP